MAGAANLESPLQGGSGEKAMMAVRAPSITDFDPQSAEY
jgi:hypothetical protein